MIREYTPNELLLLSGIQHFLCCRRQGALIRVGMQERNVASYIPGLSGVCDVVEFTGAADEQ